MFKKKCSITTKKALLTSPSPSPSPKSKPRIPRGKVEFGLWAVSKILLATQMSMSSLGTTFVKQSLPEIVTFPVKTAPILHLWWWILGG